MPGVEFLQAFAKFFVDKSEYDKGLDEAVKHGEDASKKIEQSFSEGFKRGFGRGGEALEELGTLAGKAAAIVTSPLAAAAAAGGLLVEQLVVSVEKGLEFDREFTKIKVLLGDNEEASHHAREAIEGVNTSLGTAVEYAKAYRSAFLNTGSAEAAEEITKVSFALAKVADADTIATTRLIGDLLDGLGKKSSDAGELAGKLFYLMKSGGGDINELGGGFLNLVDTAQTLKLPFEEIVGSLVRLGEVAGAAPQRNIQSLNIALGALEGHKSRLLEQGIDLDEVIKSEGLIGALRVLNVVTGGNREALREFGIQGRNVNAIMKLMEDTAGESGEALRTKFAEAGVAGATDLEQALATRAAAISTQVQSYKNEITKLQEATGGGILSIVQGVQNFFNPAGAPDADFETVDQRLGELEERRRRFLEMGQTAGGRGEAVIGLQLMQPEYEALLRRKAVLEATAEAEWKKGEIEDRLNNTLHEETDATRQITAVEEARREQVARLADELGIAAKKIGDLGPQQLAQAEALAEASRKAFTELLVLAEETSQKEADRERQRVTGTLQANLSVAESERALEVERARMEGRQSRGLEELLALKKSTLTEGAAAELSALDEVTASQERATQARIASLREEADLIRSRPGFETNFGLRQKAVGLDAEIEKAEAALANLQGDAENKRVALAEKTHLSLTQFILEEYKLRRDKVVEAQRLDDEAFAHRLAMGGATIQEEIDRAKVMSMDPDRTSTERLKFAEQARTRERAAGREEIEFRRSLGMATLQDEITYQQQLVDATARGTQQRRDLEKRLADDVRSFRSAAASAANSLFDLAASRTEKERNAGLDAEIQRIRDEQDRESGKELSPQERRLRELEAAKRRPVELSNEDVQAQFEEARAEARRGAQIFGAGGAITPEQFKAIGTIAGIDDQLSQFGGGLAGASVALRQFAENLLVPFGEEARRRGLGQGGFGTTALTPNALDDEATRNMKQDALAEIARLRANAAEAAYGWSDTTSPRMGGPGEFVPRGSQATGRSLMDDVSDGFGRGLTEASTGGDTEGRAALLARALYVRVYDMLVTDLQREAERA